MDSKKYRCLYNHEMLILFTTQSPYQTYRENVKPEQVKGYVKELENTQVDALMCCPTAWRMVLWPSEIEKHWQEEAPHETEPLPESDWKYYDKAYYRIRRYMLAGNDPLLMTLESAREAGLDFFISYRMNDHHYLNNPDCPTHRGFWQKHPEYRIEPGKGTYLNYLLPEVRDYYFSLLDELAAKYDIDGIELDLQRSPVFFPKNMINEGCLIMNDFIKRIRCMLDKTGRKRGKYLQLCVRVPHTLNLCAQAGLDPAAWDRERLIDIVNISPFFRNTMDVDIEGFREAVSNARLYGEMHFITCPGKTKAGYGNNINRRTTKEIYETTAYDFLQRGVDGLSFFNFAYTRDHSFNEPRRKEFPGIEPPFEVLENICDSCYLKKQPKHYYIGSGFGTFPATNEKELKLKLHDDISAGIYKSAVVRIETENECLRIPIEVYFNGYKLDETIKSGELFDPFSREALPESENLRYFELSLKYIEEGENRIRIRRSSADPYQRIVFIGFELALYTV